MNFKDFRFFHSKFKFMKGGTEVRQQNEKRVKIKVGRIRKNPSVGL